MQQQIGAPFRTGGSPAMVWLHRIWPRDKDDIPLQQEKFGDKLFINFKRLTISWGRVGRPAEKLVAGYSRKRFDQEIKAKIMEWIFFQMNAEAREAILVIKDEMCIALNAIANYLEQKNGAG